VLAFAKVAGLLLSAAALVGMFFMVRRFAGSAWAGVAAAVILGHSVDYVVNAGLGLETALFLFLLTLALAALFALADEPTARRGALAGLALAGLALTRPEGPVLFLVGLAWLAFAWRGRMHLRATVWMVALFGAIVVPYLAFRYGYYGDILPTAVRAKQVKDAEGFVARYLADHPLAAGPAYVIDVFRTYAPCVFLTAATVLVASRQTQQRLLLLIGIVVAYIAGIWFTWPVMGTAHRLLLPAVLAVIAAAAPGVVALLRRWRSPAAIAVAAAVGLVGLTFMHAQEVPGNYWNQHGPYRGFLEGYAAQLRAVHEPLARDLARAPGITVAMTDVGLVGYRSGATMIDLFGLTDRHIARVGPDAAYVLDRRPEVIVLMSQEPDRYAGWYEWEKPIWEHAAFRREYVRDGVREGPQTLFVVFRRKDWHWPSG
jgi:4-amino-4-deoxy-L-arabinose transferase-like glycosyltransferase